MTTRRWALITGEYPPQPGGVADHCGILAERLAERGDHVEVWAPACAGRRGEQAKGVVLHELPGRFDIASLRAGQSLYHEKFSWEHLLGVFSGMAS